MVFILLKGLVLIKNMVLIKIIVSMKTTPYSTRHPVMLYRGHYFTTLIIRSAHMWVQNNSVQKDTEKFVRVLDRNWKELGPTYHTTVCCLPEI